MLLNIDKVLALIAEGKDIEKIAKAASVGSEDVVAIVNEARELLAKYEPDRSKKKIVIRKKSVETPHDEIFNGADLSAVPVEGNLRFFAAVSQKPQGYSAGILINDESGKQLGKIHYNFSERNAKDALLKTVIRCYHIAHFFKVKSLRVFIDNMPAIRVIRGADKDIDQATKDIMEELTTLRASFQDEKIEILNRQQNEKAGYLSTKRVKRTK